VGSLLEGAGLKVDALDAVPILGRWEGAFDQGLSVETQSGSKTVVFAELESREDFAGGRKK